LHACSVGVHRCRPALLATACFSCHGVDGKSVGEIPPIAGKTAAQMSTALKAFKSDQVMGTIMNRLAKGYSDAEIDALATYYANLR
jgi:cytochrome subunit of sulfide dehydrogenase